MNLSYRNATLADLVNMQQLFAETIQTVCANDYNPEQIEAWISKGSKPDRWIKRFDEQLILVAETEGELAGFISLKNGDCVDMLFVNQNFQRRGIAKELLTRIEEHTRKLNTRSLSAHVSITAEGFFRQQGFDKISDQKNLVDGVSLPNTLMMKQLS